MKRRVHKRRMSRQVRMSKVFLRKCIKDTHTRWSAMALAYWWKERALYEAAPTATADYYWVTP